jgi:hypothetical protein
MLSAAIAYQVLQQENPPAIEKVKAVLEKHPWYANQWQTRLQDVPATDRDQVLFMQAARWADDIRTQDKAQNRPPWHFINFPFKPEGQPASVQTREPRHCLELAIGFLRCRRLWPKPAMTSLTGLSFGQRQRCLLIDSRIRAACLPGNS